MSEQENGEKAFRKKQRAVLNTIREACIYRSPLFISDGEMTKTFVPIQLKENSFRELEEIRFLFTLGEAFECESATYSAKIEDKGELHSVELKFHDVSEDGALIWALDIAQLSYDNRRRQSRKIANESFFFPILIYLNDAKKFPIPAFARTIDYDRQAISFEVKAETQLSEDELAGSQFYFQPDLLPVVEDALKAHVIRNFSVSKQFDSYQTSAVIVSKAQFLGDRTSISNSLIQPIEPTQLKLKLFFKEPITIDVAIIRVLSDGFEGEVLPAIRKTLPQIFLAEHEESRARFNVLNHEDGVVFRSATDDLGSRVQWYNFLTKLILKYQYQFHADDAQEVTRLMLESGNYSSKAISELVLQHSYLKNKWPQEESVPKTKFRWLVKDSEGVVIGHTAGLRVSESLWAAIDNIGSQSYLGSWNSEYVARWIRSFAELLEGHSTDPLVQWTYNPKAGIWNEFDKNLESRSELVHCKDRIWSCLFSNVIYEKDIERSIYDAEELTHPEGLYSKWVADFNLCDNRLFEVICKGTLNGSSFLSNFESDYSLKYRRFFFLIRKNGKPFSVVTFSNYPVWASLNKTHDWAYVFPVNPEDHSFENEMEFISGLREIIYKAGCTPYRLGISSQLVKLSVGHESINLILKPAALEYAAQTLDAI